jgi:hypothetical protein
MYCPGCAKQSIEELRFCNNCGTNLAIVKQALTGAYTEAQAAEIQLPPQFLELDRTSMQLKKVGVIMITAGPIWGITMLILGELCLHLSWGLGRFITDLSLFALLLMASGVMTLIYRKIVYKTNNVAEIKALASHRATASAPQQLAAITANPLASPLATPLAGAELPPGRPLLAAATQPHRMNWRAAPIISILPRASRKILPADCRARARRSRLSNIK